MHPKISEELGKNIADTIGGKYVLDIADNSKGLSIVQIQTNKQ